MPSQLVCVTILLAACSDYAVVPRDQNVEGGGSTDTANPVLPGDTAQTEACQPDLPAAGSVPVADECLAPPVTFGDRLEWEWTDAWAGGTPVVGELTDDNADGVVDTSDVPDVAIDTLDGNLVVLSGDGTGVKWIYAADGGSEEVTPALGDVDGDGFPDVVWAFPVSGWHTHLVALDGRTGALKWEIDTGYGLDEGMSCAAMLLADLDSDGSAEVIVGNRIFRGSDGSAVAVGQYGGGMGVKMYPDSVRIGANPVVADLDLDGTAELVTGNAAYRPDGSTIWYNGELDSWVAVANFDDDPLGEIVAGRDGEVRLQDSDGTVLWRTVVFDQGDSVTNGAPTVADFDGDGQPEIGVAGEDVHGVDSYVVLDTDGTELWRAPVVDASSHVTVAVAFDFDGDGAYEIVYADEHDVWIFDGRTGAVLLDEPHHSSGTCINSPALADVDNDGHVEILVTSDTTLGDFSGVAVFGSADESWPGAAPVWNQHAYSITNVTNDLGIPASSIAPWTVQNSFRAGERLGPLPGDVLPSADVFVTFADVCEDACDEGDIRVWIQIGNRGSLDAGEQTVILTATTPVGPVEVGRQTLPAVPSGQVLVPLEFDLSGLQYWDIDDLQVSLLVGDDGEQCDSAQNDLALLGHPVCADL